MADIQDSTEVIHRIDQDTKGDNSVRFDELVRLLELGTDKELNLHLEGFHHSDLADAFGLLDRSLRKRLIESVKE